VADRCEPLLELTRRTLRIGSEERTRGLRRSHLGDGRCVAWAGAAAGPLAVDGEVVRPVPAALSRRFGAVRFWDRWTRLEVVAKLTGEPVARLHRDRLDPPEIRGLELVTVRVDDVVVSVGRLPRRARVLPSTPEGR